MPYVPREAMNPKASPMPLKFAPTLSSESQDARISVVARARNQATGAPTRIETVAQTTPSPRLVAIAR